MSAVIEVDMERLEDLTCRYGGVMEADYDHPDGPRVWATVRGSTYWARLP